jgi:4-hydroxythreonine-4-phosphate dehydrogenase
VKTIRNAPAPIAVSMGDPAGIGPEVILKAAAKLRSRDISLCVVGDIGAMRRAADAMRKSPRIDIVAVGHPNEALGTRGAVAVLSVGELPLDTNVPGRPTVAGADASFRYVRAAVKLALNGDAAVVVTAPISKEWWHRAGHRWPGHTELIARMAHARNPGMMFYSGAMIVALATLHVALRDVPRLVTRSKVLMTIRTLADHLSRFHDFKRPRIGVLGLNPHAGEAGMFGDEETRRIAPAIRAAVREGIDAHGPLPPDTAFIRPMREGRFDAYVAMYHDQGLIALKTVDFESAVNVTMGLPFIRTSPDHGTAFDIAGRGCADPASMIAAIEYAAGFRGAR